MIIFEINGHCKDTAHVGVVGKELSVAALTKTTDPVKCALPINYLATPLHLCNNRKYDNVRVSYPLMLRSKGWSLSVVFTGTST